MSIWYTWWGGFFIGQISLCLVLLLVAYFGKKYIMYRLQKSMVKKMMKGIVMEDKE